MESVFWRLQGIGFAAIPREMSDFVRIKNYPTRLDHSLGAARLVHHLRALAPRERKLLFEALLLHDIGHGPFNHASEEFMEEIVGKGHEE